MPKPNVEKSVFEAFLHARGLECTREEIHQPRPPAPDILWRPATGTPLAFELTEVVEERVAEHLAVTQAANRACWEEFQRLSDERRSALDGRMTSIRMHPSNGKRCVIGACREVVRALSSRSAEFESNRSVDLHVAIGSPRTLVEVSVSEPLGFTSFRLGWMGTWQERWPTVRAIETKLRKSYESRPDIELLAYFWKQHSGHFDRFERRALESRFNSDAARSPFRRIWVFDARRGVLLALFPQSDASTLGVDTGQADPGVG